MKVRDRVLITVALAALGLAIVSLIRPVIAARELHPVKQLGASESIAAGTTLAASRSVTFYPSGGGEGQSYGLALLYTTVTDANDSETGVVLSCHGLRHGSATEYVIPACVWDSVNLRYNCDDTAAAGVANGAEQFWNPSDETAADTKSRVFRLDVEGFTAVKCTYAFTGGAAADSIEVLVDVATKS